MSWIEYTQVRCLKYYMSNYFNSHYIELRSCIICLFQIYASEVLHLYHVTHLHETITSYWWDTKCKYYSRFKLSFFLLWWMSHFLFKYILIFLLTINSIPYHWYTVHGFFCLKTYQCFITLTYYIKQVFRRSFLMVDSWKNFCLILRFPSKSDFSLLIYLTNLWVIRSNTLQHSQ